jgi:hypothetical protein
MKARNLVVACSGVFLAGVLGGGYAASFNGGGVIDSHKAIVSEQGAKAAAVNADGGAVPNYYVGMAKEEQHFWYWKVLQFGAIHGRVAVSESGSRRLRHRMART